MGLPQAAWVAFQGRAGRLLELLTLLEQSGSVETCTAEDAVTMESCSTIRQQQQDSNMHPFSTHPGVRKSGKASEGTLDSVAYSLADKDALRAASDVPTTAACILQNVTATCSLKVELDVRNTWIHTVVLQESKLPKA